MTINKTSVGTSTGVIVKFPRRRNHPPTLSEVVSKYRVTHSPKGDYKTPLPDDRKVQ